MNTTERKDKKGNIWKCLVKVITFVLVFLILLKGVIRVMTVDTDDMQYQFMTAVYDEEPNSLDVICLGSSNCFSYWNPVAAYEEYGITACTYSCGSQPLLVAEYLIREMRKKQPDAVYVVNINTLGDGHVQDVVMHRLLDYMPFSKEKMEFTEYLTDVEDLSFEESLEYYFPLIRYHSRWSELVPGNFREWDNNVKGTAVFPSYLKKIEDITKEYKVTDDKEEITDVLRDSIDSLLAYCEEEDVKVVFVTVPRAEGSVKTVAKFNTVNEILRESDYPVLDLMESTDEINLDMRYDFMNGTHTNIHGSIKYTHYMSEYFMKEFDLEDKRDNPDYKSWEEAFNNYTEISAPYVLDFEYDRNSRNYALEVPQELKCTRSEERIELTWNEVQGANGYSVYRKKSDTDKWTFVKETTDNSYSDIDVVKDRKYIYTVVPFSGSEDEKLYGNFSYSGVAIKY